MDLPKSRETANRLRLVTPTQVSSSVHLGITKPVLPTYGTLINVSLSSMALDLANLNRVRTPGPYHMLNDSSKIAHLKPEAREWKSHQRPTSGPDNIKIVNTKMIRPTSLQSQNRTPKFSTLHRLEWTRNWHKGTATL